MHTLQTQTPLSSMLAWCETEGASDLHIQSGIPLRYRVHGELRLVPEDLFPRLEEQDIVSMLRQGFSEEVASKVEASMERDMSFYHGSVRYRANFSKQMGQQACSFRIVPQQRQHLQDLRLPVSLYDLIKEPRGLILATGPTGQGKSTTMRALIQYLNETSALRIISVEDPIEYVFASERSQIEQREVGLDTSSFATGIRNAMRQDPEVIFVGEIRDRESITAAMQAAETGHLVLTTLHADSTAQAVARIREFFPTPEQESLCSLLSRNLKAVICQRLLPACDGGRTPCLEIMRSHPGVQEAIRTFQLHLLPRIIESSVHEGMHTFDQYLIELLSAEEIDEPTARFYAINRHKLDLAIDGIETHVPILFNNNVSGW